jgi:copper homeostasis protein
MKYSLETIAFNIQSCTLAQKAGVDRIELCDNPAEGGTTPSAGFIKVARGLLTIELFPIIRPRGGDFFYSDEEFEIMKTDIQYCKEVGCDGVVFGLLNDDASVAVEQCKTLVQLAYPMSATFHRAFDRVVNGSKALEHIIECGFERILTSGFHPTAMEGTAQIKKLVTQANERIIIMPGSGVRSANIKEIAESTGAIEFHSSARKHEQSNMKVVNKNMKENLEQTIVDDTEIKKMRDILLMIP